MSERGRKLLVPGLIIGVFVAFALAGRFFINPADMDRTNRGNLIVPHIAIDTLELQKEDGQAWTGEDMTGQWSLMYVGGERCERACKNALFYLMHRLRQSLGRDSDRLRLIMAHTAPPSEALHTFMTEKLDNPVELHGDPEIVTRALTPAFGGTDRDPRHHLYLVAPDGQIFMWYPTHAEKEPLLREADNIHNDLKRTLKGSLIG